MWGRGMMDGIPAGRPVASQDISPYQPSGKPSSLQTVIAGLGRHCLLRPSVFGTASQRYLLGFCLVHSRFPCRGRMKKIKMKDLGARASGYLAQMCALCVGLAEKTIPILWDGIVYLTQTKACILFFVVR
ncbi:hypothetical protein AVEN_203064-1 [Araneus ventricosus]|uniref:Uncharacterized protein n=1 Tax=Araneus ventricosus TaxID=182803 RepID=A0A4Y2G9I2_ARAVE|nr:hypothetical protein AVEN_203064-1 [Araneus ventricosus]